MFSILIPTWNNLPFLQLCVESIRNYGTVETQIIVHVNDGSDGTLDWVKKEGLDYTHTAENAGICVAVNMAGRLARFEYIVFMNDDMFVLPDWDTELLNRIRALDTDCFMLSGTMIEPYDTKNKCVIVADYGKSVDGFERASLLQNYKLPLKGDWNGSTWPPTAVHRKWWKQLGGYSEEFSPGMASDDDFAMKMWSAGCRIFLGVSGSRVYHFISKSTGRVVKNDGKKQFLNKWGMKQSTFHKYYLHRGDPYMGKLKEPPMGLGLWFQNFLVRMQNLL